MLAVPAVLHIVLSYQQLTVVAPQSQADFQREPQSLDGFLGMETERCAYSDLLVIARIPE
jgi:hypothetical protein